MNQLTDEIIFESGNADDCSSVSENVSCGVDENKKSEGVDLMFKDQGIFFEKKEVEAVSVKTHKELADELFGQDGIEIIAQEKDRDDEN